MFSHAHYVPVMRTKAAELWALRRVSPSVARNITPLLECPPSVLAACASLDELTRKFIRIARQLTPWHDEAILIDFRDLAKWGLPHPVDLMASAAIRFGIHPVPVFSLRTPQDTAFERALQRTADATNAGIALRISPEEFKCSRLHEMIDARLRRSGVPARQVHLLIDRGEIGSGSVRYAEFAGLIPDIDSWNTVTLLAGSFPEDLAGLERLQIHRLPRHEWRQWTDLRTWTGRRPAYGDYVTQHVVYRDPVPMPNPSASIRYSTEDAFVVLRGEGIMNPGGPGRSQWPAWAELLTGMPEYFGPDFSAGDRYIADHGAIATNAGSPQTWLQASFSHHVTMTALQVTGRLVRAQREPLHEERDVQQADIPAPQRPQQTPAFPRSATR
jgi:hypothetical protein